MCRKRISQHLDLGPSLQSWDFGPGLHWLGWFAFVRVRSFSILGQKGGTAEGWEGEKHTHLHKQTWMHSYNYIYRQQRTCIASMSSGSPAGSVTLGYRIGAQASTYLPCVHELGSTSWVHDLGLPNWGPGKHLLALCPRARVHKLGPQAAGLSMRGVEVHEINPLRGLRLRTLKQANLAAIAPFLKRPFLGAIAPFLKPANLEAIAPF